jgi:hypothetical protein
LNFVFNILRLSGYILLPMFFRAPSHAGLLGVLHALVIVAITAGLGFLHIHFHWKQYLDHGPEWLRQIWAPVLFLLCYLLAWFGWWLWKLFRTEETAGQFPDLDACWAEAQAALQKVGIGLGDTPVYLVLGKLRGDEAALFQHGSALAVNGVPGTGAPLRVYAHREAIYVTCTGASLSGRQAELLEGPVSEISVAGEAGSVGGSIGLDKSIGMSAGGGGPLADVQLIIRRARDENRSLTASEHQRIRELTGMAGGGRQAGDGAATTRAHASVFRNADEAEHHAARLHYLGRLLAGSRGPLCPCNGIVLLVSMAATDNDDDAQQASLAGLRDLQTIRDSARLHCPVFALVGDLDHLVGAREFMAHFPADKLRQRLGKSFPLVPDIGPDAVPAAVETSVRWIFDSLLPFWVFKLFRVESAGASASSSVDANAHLFQFLNDLRPRAARMARLISKAVVFGSDAPPLFGGCYLAGSESGRGFAFVPGFLKRLDDAQGYVAWTAEAFESDARYRGRTQMGYVALAAGVALVAALAGWVIWGKA